MQRSEARVTRVCISQQTHVFHHRPREFLTFWQKTCKDEELMEGLQEAEGRPAQAISNGAKDGRVTLAVQGEVLGQA